MPSNMSTHPSSNSSVAASARFARRTVVKSFAWSIPVIAATVAVPAQAASVTPPPANFAQVTAVANPKAGSNTRFKAAGQFYDGESYGDGTLKAGELFTISFSQGVTASSINHLLGLVYVSGDPTKGGDVIFQVAADTAGDVSLRVNNIQPAGGLITATILGGSGNSKISA